MGNIEGCCKESEANTTHDRHGSHIKFRDHVIHSNSIKKQLISQQRMNLEIEENERIDGCIIAKIYNAKFDEKLLETMKKKSALIDVSKISLYVDLISYEQTTNDPLNSSFTS